MGSKCAATQFFVAPSPSAVSNIATAISIAACLAFS